MVALPLMWSGRVRAGQRRLRCPSLFLRLSDPMRSLRIWSAQGLWGGGQGAELDTVSSSSAQGIMINKADPTPASRGGGGLVALLQGDEKRFLLLVCLCLLYDFTKVFFLFLDFIQHPTARKALWE